MKKILLFLLISLFYVNNSYALNLSRVKTWVNAEILTHTDLNAEFDNILNHAIANADVSATAAIAASKIDFSVASAIGSTTPSTGAFTTLSSTGATTIGDATGDAFTINPSAWTLNNAVTITGTWTDLGTVTTANIDGGTADDVDIGSTTADLGTFTTLVAQTSLNPDAADGAPMGTIALEWSDLYLADSAVIYFGLDQDETFTHNPDVGVIFGGTAPRFTIGDAGAEDTSIVFDGNAQDYHLGLDDTDDDLKIGLGTALGTTDSIVIDESGRITQPLQPCFQVRLSGNQSNIVAGADRTVIFDTEVFDVGSNFNNATYTFTAPVTGKYLLTTNLYIAELDSAMTNFNVEIITSNRTYYNDITGTLLGADATSTLSLVVVADMDVNDTAYVIVNQSGGANQADITSGASSYASGTLIN